VGVDERIVRAVAPARFFVAARWVCGVRVIASVAGVSNMMCSASASRASSTRTAGSAARRPLSSVDSQVRAVEDGAAPTSIRRLRR
jgi:hypothetical protein